DDRIASDRDRSNLDSPRPRPVALEERLLANDRARTNREQVGANRESPREDHDARADLRAERPQVRRVERRAHEPPSTRNRPEESLDDPKAYVGQTPEADL